MPWKSDENGVWTLGLPDRTMPRASVSWHSSVAGSASVGVRLRVLVAALLVMPPSIVAGQEAPASLSVANADRADREEARQRVNRNFLGINFGVAFGMTIDLGSGDRVEDAEVANGVVRLTKEANHKPRILLETHYFWEVDAEDAVVVVAGEEVRVRAADIGLGPFAAIQGSEDELLEAFAIGVMVGFRRAESSSFNIGIGVALDPNVKVLGDGVRRNERLPEGETSIRFKEQARWGLLTLVSFSF